MFGFNLNKKLTEKLYQKNLDFEVKNTTFELLEKLYQASILTLMPEEMSRQITDIILKDLTTELAGIYIFTKENDTLEPLAFSKSDTLVADLHKSEFLFETVAITAVASHPFFKKIVYGKEDNVSKNIKEIYQDFIPSANLENITEHSAIKNFLGYPLMKGQEVMGMLLLGINRDYDNIGIFERSSIRSIINAIALLVDKAQLYQNLSVAYELEKKSRAKVQQAYELEKKSKQDLQKLDQDKTDFMLITQHHLRTPLTSIGWSINLIEGGTYGKVPKKLQEVIHKFGVSNKLLIKIVDEFLDISQFKLSQKVINVSKGVNLESMVFDIVKELGAQAEAKKISVRIQPTKEKLPLIEADLVKLPTAITSIIDDGIKYTSKGGVSIKLEVNKQNAAVRIIIHDTGMGIEKSDLPTLFDNLFSRGQKAQVSNATGRGVGLYLANKIIQAHQGKVWAESEGKDQGSTFYIELPIAQKRENVVAP